MASDARNDAQVKAMLMPALKGAVDYVVKQILAENEKLIQQIVYDGYTPVEYDRTDQFKKAWDTNTHITSNMVTGEMAYDILVNGTDIKTMEVKSAPKFTKEYLPDRAKELGITVPDGYEEISAE